MVASANSNNTSLQKKQDLLLKQLTNCEYNLAQFENQQKPKVSKVEFNITEIQKECEHILQLLSDMKRLEFEKASSDQVAYLAKRL